jgi:HPt (histidine-containing phosphotransfer) domain-containing protein
MANSSDAPTTDQEMAQKLSELWHALKDIVFAQVSVIEGAAQASLDGRLGEDLRRSAESEAHKLAGSIGSFGFEHCSRLASEMERLLKSAAPLDREPRLSELVAELRRELESQGK